MKYPLLKDIEPGQTVLGTGAFGQVTLGKYRGQEVAVKQNLKHKNPCSFDAEIKVHSALQHPNVVALFAVEYMPSKIYMALELVRGRSLADLLDKKIPFSMEKNISMIEGVACFDTDLARIKYDIRGHSDYMPPEVISVWLNNTWDNPRNKLTFPYSKAADIFSFGALMSEMLRRDIPFSSYPYLTETHAEVRQYLRYRLSDNIDEKLPDNTPIGLKQTIEQCLEKTPSLRPTAEVILSHSRLSFLHQTEHQTAEKNWDVLSSDSEDVPFSKIPG